MTNILTLQETIRPSADLRNHYSEISKLCKENKEAVIITVNGRGDTVTLSYEEYKNMKARIELLEVLLQKAVWKSLIHSGCYQRISVLLSKVHHPALQEYCLRRFP